MKLWLLPAWPGPHWPPPFHEGCATPETPAAADLGAASSMTEQPLAPRPKRAPRGLSAPSRRALK
eukprot:7066072-Pyramimonas_sp.AAC.1